jgi:SAM-dependent methyltransferase
MNIKKNLLELKKKNDYRPVWYSIFINPFFIIRLGLYRAIKDFAGKNDGGKLLDVGCGSRPYEKLFPGSEYTGIDVEGGGHKPEDKMPDKYFDGLNIPYDGGSFDKAICTEVLEHSPEPEKLINEIARVLKTNGAFYLTVPFVWYEHEVPYDFQRFTSFGLKKLLEKDFVVESISPISGVFGTVGAIISAFVIENFKPKNFVTYPLLCAFVCAPVQLFYLLLEKIFGRRWLPLGWAVIAKRK